MAASAKMHELEEHNPTEDWTIVLPRRGKVKKNFRRSIASQKPKQEGPWTPIDLETDPQRESRLMQKMQAYIQRLENSQFFSTFMDQIQAPDVLDRFLKILGPEAKMQMVIYGIGSIESFEPPRLQLSLAILMKKKFNWIGEIEVFDPIISLAESKVLTAFGCTVLSVNEQGRRQALEPTMFFMPHCEAELYDNLLQVNWRADMLNRIVLFGNSFGAYEQYISICKNLIVTDSRKHILAVRRFTKEYEIQTVSDDCFRAFHGSSWHFFSLESEANIFLAI